MSDAGCDYLNLLLADEIFFTGNELGFHMFCSLVVCSMFCICFPYVLFVSGISFCILALQEHINNIAARIVIEQMRKNGERFKILLFRSITLFSHSGPTSENLPSGNLEPTNYWLTCFSIPTKMSF